MLKCKVNHLGYDETEFHGQTNWVQAELNIQFKPKEIKRLEGGDFNVVHVVFQGRDRYFPLFSLVNFLLDCRNKNSVISLNST